MFVIGYVAVLLGMAMRYIKLSNCGTAASQGRDADDVEMAATVLIVGTKRRWGGSTPGHKTYKRDREGANKILNAHFRRRCGRELKHNFYYIVNQICSK